MLSGPLMSNPLMKKRTGKKEMALLIVQIHILVVFLAGILWAIAKLKERNTAFMAPFFAEESVSKEVSGEEGDAGEAARRATVIIPP